MQVGYKGGSFSVIYSDKSEGTINTLISRYEFEVIGNIYENPELIIKSDMKFENYKGKFDILIDSDDMDIAESKGYIYENYNSARYYGVPVYSGRNKELIKLEKLLNKTYDFAYDMNNYEK